LKLFDFNLLCLHLAPSLGAPYSDFVKEFSIGEPEALIGYRAPLFAQW